MQQSMTSGGNAPTAAPPIRWRRCELIGSGAFGQVYMGMNLDSGELLAGKQVSIPANNISKEKAQSLNGHSSPIESVAFASAEVLAVAGASSGVIKLWDLEETKEMYCCKHQWC